MFLIISGLMMSGFFSSCVGRAIYCYKDAKEFNDMERIKKFGTTPLIESIVYFLLCVFGTITGCFQRFGFNNIKLIILVFIEVGFLVIGTVYGIVYSNSAIKRNIRQKAIR